MRWFALEGGGDLRAAFLKNRGAHHDQQPKSGEEGEGAQSCNHRFDPSWERLTELDLFCSSLEGIALLKCDNVLCSFSFVKRVPNPQAKRLKRGASSASGRASTRMGSNIHRSVGAFRHAR
jgi:hypothetical protein